MSKEVTSGKVLEFEVIERAGEEAEAAICEGRFLINVVKIETAHSLGEILRRYSKLIPATKLVTALSSRIGISERTIFRAGEVYDIEPFEGGAQKLIDKHGKNVTVTQLLRGPEAEDCKHPEEKVREVNYKECGCCGKRC